MFEDLEAVVVGCEKQSTVAQCEAVIHHHPHTVHYARELMARAHAILEVRIQEERQIEISKRAPDFPNPQQIGVS
jgi:hypothetical protein